MVHEESELICFHIHQIVAAAAVYDAAVAVAVVDVAGDDDVQGLLTPWDARHDCNPLAP